MVQDSKGEEMCELWDGSKHKFRDAQVERESTLVGLQNPSQAWVYCYCTYTLIYYDYES